MAMQTITVFGGTGFLGRRVVECLIERGFRVRIASRHPKQSATAFPDAGVEKVHADVNDDSSVAAAVAESFGVVNAVSLYVERHGQTFKSVHVDAAGRVARHAKQAGVERLSHLSGIGSDERSSSAYIRSRGQGERVVREAFPSVTLIRPAVMFGPDDAFVVPVSQMLRRFPVFPLFGKGETQVQPAYVGDVAKAVARTFQVPQPAPVYELGGARIYRYKKLLQVLIEHLGTRTKLVPMPFGLWLRLAALAEQLPNPPITRNQVELMEIDNVCSPDTPWFPDLDIQPQSLESVLPTIVPRR